MKRYTIAGLAAAIAAAGIAAHPEVRLRVRLALHVIQGRPLGYRLNVRHGEVAIDQDRTWLQESDINAALRPEHQEALDAIRKAAEALEQRTAVRVTDVHGARLVGVSVRNAHVGVSA